MKRNRIQGWRSRWDKFAAIKFCADVEAKDVEAKPVYILHSPLHILRLSVVSGSITFLRPQIAGKRPKCWDPNLE